MPIRHPEQVQARKSVDALFRRYMQALMRQFTTPPEELLRRAEAALAARGPTLPPIEEPGNGTAAPVA